MVTQMNSLIETVLLRLKLMNKNICTILRSFFSSGCMLYRRCPFLFRLMMSEVNPRSQSVKKNPRKIMSSWIIMSEITSETMSWQTIRMKNRVDRTPGWPRRSQNNFLCSEIYRVRSSNHSRYFEKRCLTDWDPDHLTNLHPVQHWYE